jgi:hypothetical protein
VLCSSIGDSRGWIEVLLQEILDPSRFGHP